MKKWKQGFINLGLVLLISYVLQFFIAEPVVWIAALSGISSGAWAYLVALDLEIKEKLESQPSDSSNLHSPSAQGADGR
jgi:hypothetical protein